MFIFSATAPLLISMELNALLAVPAVLPSLPRVVALLIAELARDEPNLRRVNQLVGSDPALAARVLACASWTRCASSGAPETTVMAVPCPRCSTPATRAWPAPCGVHPAGHR